MGEIAERLKELIQEKCQALDIEIGSMEVMLVHVHLFLRAKPIHAPHYIVGQQIKRYTSHILREEFASLTRQLALLVNQKLLCSCPLTTKLLAVLAFHEM